MARSSTSFKKGNRANPNGRPRILLPEVQALIQQNKNVCRVVAIQLLGEKDKDGITAYENALRSVLDKIITHGDAPSLKTYLEIAVGKMDDKPGLDLSPTEEALVLEYRRRTSERSDSSTAIERKDGEE